MPTFEKILHGGNFAACFGAIATSAVDLGLCGGTATGISAILSAHAVLKKDASLKPLALQMGEGFEAALEERTRDTVPLDWAMTQNNLGNALAVLGERENGTARLKEAVTAYKSALEEWSKDKRPLNWAFTQGNLGNLELALFDKDRQQKHLNQAETYVLGAREVFSKARADQYIGMADNQLAKIVKRRGGD